MKRALVCGAGGFIGGHLVNRLKAEGYWVRGADIREGNPYQRIHCDQYINMDLRHRVACMMALSHIHVTKGPIVFDEVYQLAANMGGMGFIATNDKDILHDNVLINTNMVHAAAEAEAKRYFYSSSVCVYPNMDLDDPPLHEHEAIPAEPDNEYGWEKLYSERVALAYGREYPMAVRIGRFFNTYGPYCDWWSNRAKAPAALCRKVAQCKPGDTFEVWGTGQAMRSYTYIDDLLDGITTLMRSDEKRPTNIGAFQRVPVHSLVAIIIKVAGKLVTPEYVPGHVGVVARHFTTNRMRNLGWTDRVNIIDGIYKTYNWIDHEIRKERR